VISSLVFGSTPTTLGNERVGVSATRRYAAENRTYNLTVDGVHTYYVLAGGTPVLVHNSSCTSFSRFYEGGGGVMADLIDGVMTMAIERNRSATSGEQMFDEAVEYFGAENVTSFAAKWVTRMPSNLDAFNANLGHMSYEDAAANTFTGQMVAKFGLTVVTVDKSKLIGKFGYYTNVEVTFSRPAK